MISDVVGQISDVFLNSDWLISSILQGLVVVVMVIVV